MTQHVAHRHSDDVHVLEMRIERLEQAAREGIKKLEADNERLRAEVARMKAERDDWKATANIKIDGLRAKIERLTGLIVAARIAIGRDENITQGLKYLHALEGK